MRKIQISDFWKNTYACTIGTIIGIILTFGTSAVIQRCEKEESGHKAALMIIRNIDDFCNGLEYDMDIWKNIDDSRFIENSGRR